MTSSLFSTTPLLCLLSLFRDYIKTSVTPIKRECTCIIQLKGSPSFWFNKIKNTLLNLGGPQYVLWVREGGCTCVFEFWTLSGMHLFIYLALSLSISIINTFLVVTVYYESYHRCTVFLKKWYISILVYCVRIFNKTNRAHGLWIKINFQFSEIRLVNGSFCIDGRVEVK